ncbi:MAG: cytochrome C oxidase subunit IV family protein [Gemmataceae bacterium]|nr:cytochrome C oxidase subunit IV family protein [Gemmataceae bacterium]
MHTPEHKTDGPSTMHDVDNPAAMFVVYLVVLGLAVANILLSTTPLGKSAIYIQLGIASVQAVLVAYYWMHMRRGDTAVTLSAFCSLFFIGIFYLLVFSDIWTRWRMAM